IHHPFESFAEQCNFGLKQVASPWVLSLDADYELDDAVVAELKSLTPPDEVAGYRSRFIYRICGHTLRWLLYAPRIGLYRRDKASYRNKGHCHRVDVDGEVRALAGVIYHDDRKPLVRWIATQLRYTHEEAVYLMNRKGALTRTDRIRLMG